MPDTKRDSKSNWHLLLSVLESTADQILEWEQSQLLTREDSQRILRDFPKLAELYLLNAENGTAFPQRDCFLPRQSKETDAIKELRTGIYMAKFLSFLRSGEVLPLSKYHALQAKLSSQMKVVERQLAVEGIHRSDLEAQCVGGSDGSKEATAEKTDPWQLTRVGLCLSGLLFPLLLFSLQGLSVPTAGEAFRTSLWLGHPLTGIWQALAISPHSWGTWTISVSFLLWPLEWAFYGFLLDCGRRRSSAVEALSVILVITLGLILIGLACYALRISISQFTLTFALALSIVGIAMISRAIIHVRSIWR
ncbi:MAG: hypothetical protein U0936_19270 [Planctomycetaceae bacterium]